MNTKLIRNTIGILLTAAILCLISAVVIAAEPDFSGTWKSETGAPAAAPAGAPGGRGGGAPGGRGGSGVSSAQKITLHLKAKNDKASGNLSTGSDTYDVKDGKIEGNKLTFKAGLPEKGIYEYEAVLSGDELTVTRKLEGGGGGTAGGPGAPGGRGGFGGGTTTFTLKRSK